jgi:hypothetical protein
MVMAGMDGIMNKIHPGDPMDKDLYDLPPEELKDIPTVCGSLREALASLDADRDFLKAGGVFSDDQIDAYIELKMEENMRYEMTPHPGRVRHVLLGLTRIPGLTRPRQTRTRGRARCFLPRVRSFLFCGSGPGALPIYAELTKPGL